MDNAGSAVNGLERMIFRIYDSQLGGAMLWEEVQQVGFVGATAILVTISPRHWTTAFLKAAARG